MSAEERRKILQMVADGKITVEEAADLMQRLMCPLMMSLMKLRSLITRSS